MAEAAQEKDGDPVLREIGARLRAAREQAGLSIDDLVYELRSRAGYKVVNKTIANYEKGERSQSIDGLYVRGVAIVTGVSADRLLGTSSSSTAELRTRLAVAIREHGAHTQGFAAAAKKAGHALTSASLDEVIAGRAPLSQRAARVIAKLLEWEEAELAPLVVSSHAAAPESKVAVTETPPWARQLSRDVEELKELIKARTVKPAK